MTRSWEPGTNYSLGDVVFFEGATYKIIQPHRSQSDWTPPVTPALWGRIPGDGDHHEQPGNQAPIQQAPPSYQQQNNAQHESNHDQKPEQGQEPPKEHHWYDDKKNVGLAVGGGIAAALLTAGGAYLAKKHHDGKHDEDNAKAWVDEARARTETFHREGPRGPATWVLTQGKDFPPSAIEAGNHHSSPLYISRAYLDGGIQIGAASGAFHKGAIFGYKHEEIERDTYEILIGDMRGLRWIPAHGKLDVNQLGHRPVEGGHENDGSPLYIIKAVYHGGSRPGKASATLDGAYIAAEHTEKNVKDYEVLCYL